MVTQTSEPVDIQAPPIAVTTYAFLITFRHPRTQDEKTIEVTSLTDSFVPVLREAQWARDAHGLRGYEIFEVLDLNSPF